MNKLSTSVETKEKNKFGLTPEQITQGLKAMRQGAESGICTFPMELFNTWHQNENNNGYKLQQELFNTPWYQTLLAGEYELLSIVATHEEIAGYHNITDLGVGNGKKFSHFIQGYKEKTSIHRLYITEIGGYILGEAKEALRAISIPTQKIHEDIVNFFSHKSKGSDTRGLYTSLGQGFGNLNSDGECTILDIPNSESGILISVCKATDDKESQKIHLKAYGRNGDDDNQEGYTASINQIKGMLQALGFSEEQTNQIDLDVQWITISDNKKAIRVGRKISGNQDITVQGVDYKAGTVYPMYDSTRFSASYFHGLIERNNTQRKYGKGDQIGRLWENDSRMVAYIKKGFSNQERREQLKEKILGLLIASLFLGVIGGGIVGGMGLPGQWDGLKELDRYHNRLNKLLINNNVKQKLFKSIASLVLTDRINDIPEYAMEGYSLDNEDTRRRGRTRDVLEPAINQFLLHHQIEDTITNENDIKTLFSQFLEEYFLTLPIDGSSVYGGINPLFSNHQYQAIIEQDSALSKDEYNDILTHLDNYSTSYYDGRLLTLYDRHRDQQVFAILATHPHKKASIIWFKSKPSYNNKKDGALSYEEVQHIYKQYFFMSETLKRYENAISQYNI